MPVRMFRSRISLGTWTRAALFTITVLMARDASTQTLPTRILVLGDSITNGLGVSEDEYYSALLRDWLGADYEIIEEGCGLTTSALWSPFSTERGPCHGFFWFLYDVYAAPNLPAHVVTLLLGTNDALRLMSPGDYEQNVVDIVEALIEDGASSVVLMTAPGLPVYYSLARRQRISQYGQVIRNICSNMDDVACGPDLIELLDVNAHFLQLDSGLRDVHPNAAGHDTIAVHLYNTIVDIPEPHPYLLQVGALVTLGVLRRKSLI